MKTIEEAKDDCINYGCLKYRESYCTAVYANGIDYGFEAGVEFAQRWISVEDELPEITTINNHNAVNVKFKTIHGDERVCTATLESVSQYCGENSPMNDVWYVYPSGGHVLRNVTHWRPIELK